MGIYDDIRNEDFRGIPEFRGAVTGYRFWYPFNSGAVRSKAIGQNFWARGVNTALCSPREEHAAPDPDCHCGFYAMVHRPTHIEVWDMRRREMAANLVFGMVKAWGIVIPGTKGWRAQFAQILAFYCDPNQPVWRLHANSTSPRIEKLSAFYQVPVFTDYDLFNAFASEHEEPYDPPGGPEEPPTMLT